MNVARLLIVKPWRIALAGALALALPLCSAAGAAAPAEKACCGKSCPAPKTVSAPRCCAAAPAPAAVKVPARGPLFAAFAAAVPVLAAPTTSETAAPARELGPPPRAPRRHTGLSPPVVFLA